MVLAIFPLSLFKEFSALRYICMMGVFVTFYISIIILIEPIFFNINNNSFSNDIKSARWFEI
jgi:hypothetical protein